MPPGWITTRYRRPVIDNVIEGEIIEVDE